MLNKNQLKYNNPSFSDIEKKTSIKIIINFIKVHLTYLPEICNKNSITNEDKITQELIILLNRNISNLPFYFHPQYIQEGKVKRQVDIGILQTKGYYNSKSIFEVECKRLPTPGTDREKEYVQREEKGKGEYVKESGAMARFKKSLYSKSLSQCSIIGYIQKNSYMEWFETINNWILEFSKDEMSIWNKDDSLFDFKENDKIAVCLSENKRIDESKIKIHHIWIMMN
jgi:hypothetical protein